jgi:hypothetical protein
VMAVLPSPYMLCHLERHVWWYLSDYWRQCETCKKVQARKPNSGANYLESEWYDVAGTGSDK